MSNQISAPNPVVITDPGGRIQQTVGQFVAPNYAAVTINTAAGTSPQTVITAPAGQYIYIVGVQITVDATCTDAGGGMSSFTLTDSAGPNNTIALLRVFIPATFTAPTVPTVLRQTAAPGSFYGSPSPGSTITAASSTALTAGSVRMSFHYGFSPVPFQSSV